MIFEDNQSSLTRLQFFKLRNTQFFIAWWKDLEEIAVSLASICLQTFPCLLCYLNYFWNIFMILHIKAGNSNMWHTWRTALASIPSDGLRCNFTSYKAYFYYSLKYFHDTMQLCKKGHDEIITCGNGTSAFTLYELFLLKGLAAFSCPLPIFIPFGIFSGYALM